MVLCVVMRSEVCIDAQLRTLCATGNCKRYPCPWRCHKKTKVPQGSAANLAKNFEVLKMA